MSWSELGEWLMWNGSYGKCGYESVHTAFELYKVLEYSWNLDKTLLSIKKTRSIIVSSEYLAVIDLILRLSFCS
jgi:hypothetical protein